MGKIRSGILSRVSGKVAGVVGGNWKNVSYLREYVKPANPNTVAQAAQRTKFSAAVAFAKPLVGAVFQPYTDKFQKGMSGFNFFIKSNISQFPTPVLTAIKLTEGPLFGVADLGVSADFGALTISWTASSLGANGSANDKVYAVAYNPLADEWTFLPAPVARSVGSASFGPSTAFDGMVIYAWTSAYNGDILRMISTSAAVTYTE